MNNREIMDIEARKISLIKEFLNIDNEKIIRAIEELLHNKKIENYESDLKPMTMERYKMEIEMAVRDEKNGRLIKADDLKKQIQEWD